MNDYILQTSGRQLSKDTRASVIFPEATRHRRFVELNSEKAGTRLYYWHA